MYIMEKNLATCDLPVRAALPDLFRALRETGTAVLSAAPGAGKTTLVPPALLDEPGLDEGLILMLEPRRVAARAAARRIAAILGEEPGKRCGYQVRGERKCSAATRILVVTEGVLLRRIQEDPALAGVGTVIFDEFHERSLEADLDLALLLDARRGLRPDLRILVMSATLELEAVSRLLGGAPVVEAAGRQFPVEIRWGDRAPDRDRPVPAVVRAVLELARERGGDMLVFLPGMREIDQARTLLRDQLPDAFLLPVLHGSLEAVEQDAALRPAPPGCRKIVLATNLAESSITIDGVETVVDSGLERQLRFDPAAGCSFLETVRSSQASAAQRAGRAGRTRPGVAFRLWNELEHRALPERNRPEILDADLSRLLLEVANWGTKVEELPWIDPPPEARLRAARQLLTDLGAFDATGKLTARGRELARIPTAPRVGAMLLAARDLDLIPLGTEVAALLEERDAFRRFAGADLRDRIRRMRSHPGEFRTQLAIRRQLLDLFHAPGREQDVEAAGMIVASGYPDWIGRARGRHSRSYLLACGSAAALEEADDLRRHEFLAVARLSGSDRGESAIRLAAPIDADEIELLFADRITTRTEVEYDPEKERAFARELRGFGAVTLTVSPVEPPPGALGEAVLRAALLRGMELPPPEAEGACALALRLGFAARMEPDRYPAPGREAIAAVLPSFLGTVRALADLRRLDWRRILESFAGFETLRELDRDYPERFTTPAGASHRIDYSGEQPTLSARVQEFYGVRLHPTVGRRRLPLRIELLSPALRPVQVTTDLPGFWSGSWQLVRKEMRGRYPKHFWPENPADALPTTRTRAKM